MHRRMMQLCERVTCRLRTLFGSSQEGMSVPLMIDEWLYIEGKLDTEFVLKMVRDQILNTGASDVIDDHACLDILNFLTPSPLTGGN